MIRLAVYGLTGIVASGVGFIAGLYLTFPSEAAITYLNFQIDKASNHEYSIAADTLGPWWATGLMFENMTVYTVKRARHVRDQPQTYDRAPFVHFDALGVRLAPFSFLTGKQGYSFAADVLSGSIDGVYAFSTDLIDLSFDIDGLDLSKLGAAGPEATFNLLGALVGEADLHLNLKEIKQSSGTMALSINGFAIGPGSKMAGFDLPETKFTTARLSFDVHDGKMSVTDGSFEGDIITGTITGDVTLNKKLGRSRSKLDLGFTLPDDYQKLADLSPTLKRSKDDEGRYHCSIGGTISAPAFRCGKGPAPRVRETTGMRASDGPLVGSGPDETELSDEERRTRREERIKERRERLKKRREEQGLTPLGTPDRPSVPFDPAEDGPPGIDQRFPDPEDMPDELPPDLPPEILEQPVEEP
jgi:type II secretion system protein N